MKILTFILFIICKNSSRKFIWIFCIVMKLYSHCLCHIDSRRIHLRSVVEHPTASLLEFRLLRWIHIFLLCTMLVSQSWINLWLSPSRVSRPKKRSKKSIIRNFSRLLSNTNTFIQLKLYVTIPRYIYLSPRLHCATVFRSLNAFSSRKRNLDITALPKLRVTNLHQSKFICISVSLILAKTVRRAST